MSADWQDIPEGTIEQRFGQRVRELRAERGWSQKAVSDALTARGRYTSQPQIGHIEAASRPVTLELAELLADVFGVPLVRLLADELDADGYLKGHRDGVEECARKVRTALGEAS